MSKNLEELDNVAGDVEQASSTLQSIAFDLKHARELVKDHSALSSVLAQAIRQVEAARKDVSIAFDLFDTYLTELEEADE